MCDEWSKSFEKLKTLANHCLWSSGWPLANMRKTLPSGHQIFQSPTGNTISSHESSLTFLAIQDSSIADIVTHSSSLWVSHLLTNCKLQSGNLAFVRNKKHCTTWRYCSLSRKVRICFELITLWLPGFWCVALHILFTAKTWKLPWLSKLHFWIAQLAFNQNFQLYFHLEGLHSPRVYESII